MRDSADSIRISRAFPRVEAVIAVLRQRAPRRVSYEQIRSDLACSKREVYSLIRLARCYLAGTTGEVIDNVHGRGWKITTAAFPVLNEVVKALDRADAHLKQALGIFDRINRSLLVDTQADLYDILRERMDQERGRLRCWVVATPKPEVA